MMSSPSGATFFLNHPEPPPEYLYNLSFQELREKREEIWELLHQWEDSPWFFHPLWEPSAIDFPDPTILYSLYAEELGSISFVMSEKYQNLMQIDEFSPQERQSLLDKTASLIKTNPKIRYAKIAELDESLTIALDYLIEKKRLWRAGKPENSYWKLKQE